MSLVIKHWTLDEGQGKVFNGLKFGLKLGLNWFSLAVGEVTSNEQREEVAFSLPTPSSVCVGSSVRLLICHSH